MREGKLFLAETFPRDLNESSSSTRRKLRRREHFWLCDGCAGHFTLRLDDTLRLTTVPLVDKTPIPFRNRVAALG
jgi:hypothetical protein